MKEHTSKSIQNLDILTKLIYNKPTCIVGGGPSVTDEVLDVINKKDWCVISINDAMYYTDPDIVYWMDNTWSKRNAEALNATKALKVCRYGDYGSFKVNHVRSFFSFSFERGSVVGWNSGLQALSLSSTLNPSSIYLFGFDCKVHNGRTHFHDRNVDKAIEPIYRFTHEFFEFNTLLKRNNITIPIYQVADENTLSFFEHIPTDRINSYV